MNNLRKIEKQYLDKQEYQSDYFEWNPALRFELEEAACLIHRQIVKSENTDRLPSPPTNITGIVVGLIDINEEIELIVRWIDHMDQYVKSEFCGDFTLVPDI